MPVVKQNEAPWYWTKEIDIADHSCGIWAGSPLNTKTRDKIYSDDITKGYVCHSTLGHIGKPCVFCGYEKEKKNASHKSQSS